MTLLQEYLLGLGLTIIPTLFVLVLSYWLGLFLLVVALLWLSLSLARLLSYSILYGSLVVLCMLGLLGHVGLLGCWPIICY
jgi:hypothetical protein